jgi:hypothetical protein
MHIEAIAIMEAIKEAFQGQMKLLALRASGCWEKRTFGCECVNVIVG